MLSAASGAIEGLESGNKVNLGACRLPCEMQDVDIEVANHEDGGALVSGCQALGLSSAFEWVCDNN